MLSRQKMPWNRKLLIFWTILIIYAILILYYSTQMTQTNIQECAKKRHTILIWKIKQNRVPKKILRVLRDVITCMHPYKIVLATLMNSSSNKCVFCYCFSILFILQKKSAYNEVLHQLLARIFWLFTVLSVYICI